MLASGQFGQAVLTTNKTKQNKKMQNKQKRLKKCFKLEYENFCYILYGQVTSIRYCRPRPWLKPDLIMEKTELMDFKMIIRNLETKCISS